MISLLLVEDHPAVAQGLAALLADEGDLTVRLATDLASAERVLELERPLVALCDVMLDGSEAGFSLLQRFGGVGGTAFVMFSAFAFPSYYARAIAYGAVGYVVKTASVDEILGAVRRAASGQRMPPASALRQARGATAVPTARELEMIGLVADGRHNEEIAATLSLSVKTVESYLRTLFVRYGVTSRTGLASLALHEGWLAGRDETQIGFPS